MYGDGESCVDEQSADWELDYEVSSECSDIPEEEMPAFFDDNTEKRPFSETVSTKLQLHLSLVLIFPSLMHNCCERR